MKVKVKGLVFVGFAAMIFAANAMAAGDNTVTSKSYVDAKISAENTISASSTDTAPNEAAVSTALAAKQDIQNTTDYKVGQNGSWAAMTSAVTEATNGYVDVTAGTNGEAVLNLDSTKMTTTFDTTNGLTSGSSNLVTEGVIKQAIANAANVDNFISQQVGTATDMAPSENAVNSYVTVKGVKVNGTALTPDANKDVNVTVASGANNGTIAVNGTDVPVTGLDSAAYKDVDEDFTNPTSTDVPTTAAVASYVGTQLTSNQADWDETVTTDPSYINNKPTALSDFDDDIDAENVLNGVKVNGTALNIDTTDKTVNLGAAAGAGLASGITSSETGLTSGQQVYNYIDNLPAADIPAMPTTGENACDATHPCALVTDANGAPVWKRIAQAGE